MGGLACAAKEIICGSGVVDTTTSGLSVLRFLDSKGVAVPDETSYYIIRCYDKMEDLADEANALILKAAGWDEAAFKAWKKRHEGDTE